jgi:hypothetical protein
VNQRNYKSLAMQAHAFNPHALLLQPKRNNFTSDSTTKDWVMSSYVLSLRGLPLPPTCVFVTVNEAWSYFASTVIANMLNKQSRTADRVLSSTLAVGQGLTTPYRKNQHVMKLFTGLRTLTDSLEPPKERKVGSGSGCKLCSAKFFWTRKWIFEVHKRREMYWLAQRLLAFKKDFASRSYYY